MLVYHCIIVYIYIKNFAWEDQRQKQCYIVHIALQGVNCAMLFIYRTGYAYMAKSRKPFKRLFLALSVLDKTVKC